MEKVIDIYNLSDFHGAILEEANKVGIIKIATFLKTIKEERKGSYLFLSAGDMYSGTYFSEVTKGKPLTQILNSLELTCMSVGNHEIADPKLMKEVLNEASFNLINSNVYCLNGNRLQIGKEYIIKELNGIKIGIIGTLGKMQKYDIINNISKDIIVKDEVNTVKKLSKFLRKEEKCEIIILLSHSNTYNLEDKIAELKDHEKVDVMINGHTHKKTCRIINCISKRKMAYIESGSSGEVIGNIRLTLSSKHHIIEEVSLENIDCCTLKERDHSYLEMINYFIRDNDLIYNEIGSIKHFYNKDIFLKAFCDYILKEYQCDIAVMNYGSIRSKGFPLFKNQIINISNIKEINPFNNYLVIGTINSDVMNFFINKCASSLYFSYINGINKEEVKVVMIDFVYFQNESLFIEHIISKENIPDIIVKMIKEEKL